MSRQRQNQLPHYDGNTYELVEWAKVLYPAKVHGEASISSPTLRFYQAGTALQVVSRQNGWVQVTDPASGQGGWVFEQYLAPADGPTVTRTAMETTASNSNGRGNALANIVGQAPKQGPVEMAGPGWELKRVQSSPSLRQC